MARAAEFTALGRGAMTRAGRRPISRQAKCTSQQKVDTFFIFYTAVKGHNTPYTVLASDSLKNTQGVLH